MTRVIVHPGFHKTGTSSLQTFMAKNADVLAPFVTFYGKAAFLQAGSAARIYGQKPYPWRLRAFRVALDRFLVSIPDDPVIVLSRETFSGAMPGHRRLFGRLVKDYERAAVPLGHQIVAALRQRFGADVQIEFFYTLREREDWISSVYGHLLRSIHLAEDFEAFRNRFPNLRDPAEESATIAARLGIDIVHFARLEDVGQHREGPASALLDLLDIPDDVRADLPAARRANVGQSADLKEEFLAMNRAGQDKIALKREKDRMLRKAKDG
ncbi:hypothetical protein AB3Y40_03275 [Yoonia sp. R2331]|uniref:hypothetical protein n=1 Tax=Yoonia sp. R2331 TaxID=3237238 RepID=UPI0034E59562